MSLAGRALFVVPLIALIDAVLLGLFELATQPDDSLIKGLRAFWLVFAYTAILAIPIGAILAFPAILLGHLLPRPKWLSLAMIGLITSILLAVLLVDGFDLRSAAGFGTLGITSALLWWFLVERFREEDEIANA